MTLASNIYFDSYFNIDAAKILPGEYYATARPMLIVTVLGSCVAACIRDRVSGIGGMNHFMLPATNNLDESFNISGCFGIYAMERLINKLLELGALHKNLEAKIFGGANLLKSFTIANVGRSNANFVRNYLNQINIPILAEDLLDNYPRKIYFFPYQGKVLVKKLRCLHNRTLIKREQEHSQLLVLPD